MAQFTPVASAVGGVLIGVASALLLWSHGKIAGISGIVGGLLGRPAAAENRWRLAFVLGLVATGGVAVLLVPAAFSGTLDRSLPALIVAGLLVGFGTRLGNGCTSGHGVCGISRLSARSLVATLLFTGFGAASVAVVRLVFGGAL